MALVVVQSQGPAVSEPAPTRAASSISARSVMLDFTKAGIQVREGRWIQFNMFAILVMATYEPIILVAGDQL